MTTENVIEIRRLTKDYGEKRGVFDVSFSVKKGEVFGFLGPNGSGKTTAVRHLLGFSKPQHGDTKIMGLDCWKSPEKVQKYLGYVAGEIAFPENMTGLQFIKQVANMRGLKNLSVAKELCDYFQFNPSGELKRMSKGMKQKTALVIAFMHDPDIFIFDEPTSGLDPLMQDKFCQLIKKQRAKGKTVLMSSHMFDEIEKTCDRVAIIKQGEIIASIGIKEIEHRADKEFEIRFKNSSDAVSFGSLAYQFTEQNTKKNRVKVVVHDKDINKFLAEVGEYRVEYISEIKSTLEKYFMKYYQDEQKEVQNETA